jgi:predicted dehydrogenase
MTPIPVGLIGAGKHGERYLRHVVEDCPGLELRLLSRRDAAAGREQAARVQARFVGDYRELLSSPEIEAVIVVVPPYLHAEICSFAAAHGKAILLEKPLAVSVAAAREIRSAVEGAGVPLMVAHTLRFNQVVRTLRRELAALGPVRQLALSQRFEPSRLDWLDDPERSGGGIVLHTGVHSFDLVRHLTGRDPRGVFAVTGRVATRRTEDNFAAVFSFEGEPLQAVVTGSRSTRGRNGTIEIAADGGQLWGDHVHGVAYRVRGTERTAIDCGPPTATVRDTALAFEDALRRGAPMPITLEDGFWSLATAVACYASIHSRQPEHIARPNGRVD